MYLKYLKYKNKYLELKNQIGGGGITDVFQIFKAAIITPELIDIMNKDKDLLGLVKPINAPAAAAAHDDYMFTEANVDYYKKKNFLCYYI